MKTKQIIGALGVVFLGLAVVFFSGGGEKVNKKTTLESLLKSNKDQECSYSSQVGGAEISAITYIANSKIRSDSTVMDGNKVTKSYMILDDQVVYIWSDASNQGIKMSLDKFKSEERGVNSETQAVNFGEEFDYSCKNWSVDNKVFVAPNNVTFRDLSSLIPSNIIPLKQDSTGGGSSQCATCDQVPVGAARDMCKQSLGCK